MPRITIHVGGREQLEPAISKATPMGLLGTEAIVRLGATSITGTAAALRALANALVEAADLAEVYDADPDAFNQGEQAQRDADH
jgi:uridylate kinase